VCGRFTQQRPSAELAALFGAEDLAESPGERYNLAPQQLGLVVVERDDLRRAIVPYRWGLIPSWAKDARIGNRRRSVPRSRSAAASSRRTASTNGSG
jgi:putative SOS response-associated peptidase YedK